MKKKINFTSLLEETVECDALIYIIKLYLKEKEGLPIVIDPINPSEIIEVDKGNIDYKFIIDVNFSLEYEYKE